MTTNGDVIDAFGDYSDSASFLSYRAYIHAYNQALRDWGIEPDIDDDAESAWEEWLYEEGTYHCPIKKSDANIAEAELIAEKVLALKGVTTNDNL